MDAARRAVCQDDPFNPLITTGTQASCMLVISHFFHLVLKPLGQPGPIAQILAGLVLGPSMLSRIDKVGNFFIQASSEAYYQLFSFIFRVLFVFLIGLETDIPYLRRNLRQASIIAYGGVITCVIFGAAIAAFVIIQLNVITEKFYLVIITMVILANSASPAVIRLAAELKFGTSDVGRLAICSSLINEMSCVIFFSVYLACTSKKLFGAAMLGLFCVVGLIVLNMYLANWSNRRNQNQKYVSNAEVLLILSLLVGVSMLIEAYGFHSTLCCFLAGMMFPREGKTARTLRHKLSYAVYNFILPVYFGYMGFLFDVSDLRKLEIFIIVVVMILLSFGGRIIGTLVACHYLKMPRNEGVILAFILNLKGHADLLMVEIISQQAHWDPTIYRLLIVIIVLNTVIAGPVVAYILRKDEKFFAHSHTALEQHDPDTELRMLSCVYGSRQMTGVIGLVSALSGLQIAPIFPYLIHLVELPKRRKTNLMYHELEDGDQYSDEEDYGGNDVVEINDAVDAFTKETKILIHQVKVVSSFSTIFEEVCNNAEDSRVSIIFLPFHKHQRIDGQMESGKEGIRTTNQKILRHAPCSVGILVDRGQTGFQLVVSERVQPVATLFFGGPDDREALACSKRIASHPRINMTLIRFLPASCIDQKVQIDDAPHGDDEVLMAISNHETEMEMDNASVEEFYNRYVTRGQVGYVEKQVENGLQTVEALRELAEMYSLFIVGKGGRGPCHMTTGMSDWEECPELGTVGDLLASSDFNINGSVLVIQRHRHSSKDLLDD
ncbi:putative monovalent cation:proton antiporter [Tripterygium wilfordii]|uniref:Putative monovalent cation:proton antiporter n=1 Tax=Tripterygium wilfordii TaxID=458696 RepID=A0A7J7D843_TRIWF|nr:putative monovalent cation:proton antiporter [Tripterygium wilfordii]